MHYLKRRWRALLLAALVMIMPVMLFAGPRAYTAWRVRGLTYTLDTVPSQRVTIVFGARVMPSGRPSHMLADRVATAAALYYAGKTDVLLMTGDNSVATYNEPETMRQYARRLGVPDDAIVLDYAGFRTYDSCYRARDIFHVDAAILVTQAFHLDRALLTCNELGIEAVGVAADVQRPQGYSTRSMFYSQMREFPASALALVDLVRRPQPVLGEPLPISSDGNRESARESG